MLHLSRGFQSHWVLPSILFSLPWPRVTRSRREVCLRMRWCVNSDSQLSASNKARARNKSLLSRKLLKFGGYYYRKLTNVQWKTEVNNFTSQTTFHQSDTSEWDLEGQSEAKNRLLWLVVLASKARDVSEFQCLVTNFKDDGGNCDDSRTVVVAATAACPGECG